MKNTVNAHCDGPCGVYDPASARIAAEAVLSMTKKMLDLTVPEQKESMVFYNNTLSRYSSIKEQEAQKCKDEILLLWTDFFKPEHLDQNPDLHTLFWNTAKLCSACKIEVSIDHANELLENIKKIHNLFWSTKGRTIDWYTAG
ncbi:MAG: superoxide dismutase, Ni [Candidatus Marinimicrobia bacterium]|nr:superoxide dismutase, Ni [Candidatus Neomarinimicrobiota bacterium]|tara:strand:- start:182 stop:610 length:429 start_codon:yes stop_codon:yes gene_type:complete